MWIVSDQYHNLTSMHRSYQRKMSMFLLMLDIHREVEFYATIRRLETSVINEEILRYLGMRD